VREQAGAVLNIEAAIHRATGQQLGIMRSLLADEIQPLKHNFRTGMLRERSTGMSVQQ
jgi:hypothetical protein